MDDEWEYEDDASALMAVVIVLGLATFGLLCAVSIVVWVVMLVLR
jgi:hypothetical protein